MLNTLHLFQAVCTPFILLDHRVANISTTQNKWLGTLTAEDAGVWIDLLITMVNFLIPFAFILKFVFHFMLHYTTNEIRKKYFTKLASLNFF